MRSAPPAGRAPMHNDTPLSTVTNIIYQTLYGNSLSEPSIKILIGTPGNSKSKQQFHSNRINWKAKIVRKPLGKQDETRFSFRVLARCLISKSVLLIVHTVVDEHSDFALWNTVAQSFTNTRRRGGAHRKWKIARTCFNTREFKIVNCYTYIKHVKHTHKNLHKIC